MPSRERRLKAKAKPKATSVAEKRYRQILSVTTVQVDPKTGDETVAFDACLRWHGLPKEGWSMLERGLIDYLARMRDQGDVAAGLDVR